MQGRKWIGGCVSTLLGMAVALLSCAAASAAAPQGLVDTQLPTPAANPLSSPTAIVPLPTGRALVLQKGGKVRVLGADGTMLLADALTLSVCTDSEEGLLGAAVDPGFATNGFVYLYYTRNAGNCASSSGRFNRVSRFTMTGDSIDPASEVVLLDNMNIPAGNHNGGDLEIGHDGDLYVTVGDGGTNPRGSGLSAARDLSLLNGKILRITTSGGVPEDNPLVGATGAQSCALAGIAAPTSARCTEIYDYGLRNPFRFAFDPNTSATRFFIDDVGQGTWEEVDDGGKGLDYGWDTREGFCANGSSTSCAPTPAGFTDPLTVYNHSTGCTFITGGAFVPDGIWAPVYDGGYLFSDGGCGKIFLRTSDGAVDYAQPFAQTSGLITDMTFLTQGGVTALYYVTNAAGQLHRITLPAAPPKPPPAVPVTPPVITPVITPAVATAGATVGRISVAHSATPPRSVRGGVVRHVVSVTSTGTAGVTIISLRDSRSGDVTRATASTCRLATAIAVGATYTCSFTVRASALGSVSDTVTVAARGDAGDSAVASATATVRVTARPCTIADVRGLLASRAAQRIAASRCTARRVFVVTPHGAPVLRKHALVRASTTSRPSRPAGRNRTWTLRVEQIGQMVGATHPAGSIERIFVGWEATPKAIAKRRGARYL